MPVSASIIFGWCISYVCLTFNLLFRPAGPQTDPWTCWTSGLSRASGTFRRGRTWWKRRKLSFSAVWVYMFNVCDDGQWHSAAPFSSTPAFLSTTYQSFDWRDLSSITKIEFSHGPWPTNPLSDAIRLSGTVNERIGKKPKTVNGSSKKAHAVFLTPAATATS